MSDGDDAPRGGSLPPGYDEDDPYADTDLAAYPAWWRRNIEEFQAHRMRPYRPPRFADGSNATERIQSLERTLDVRIRFRATNPQDGGQWELVVDGDVVREVDRERRASGYTVYDLTAAEFERLVRHAVRE